MCICMPKDQICTLKILQSMSEFSGLWKQQNKLACTKSVRVFIMLKLDTTKEEEEEKLSEDEMRWTQLIPPGTAFKNLTNLTITTEDKCLYKSKN